MYLKSNQKKQTNNVLLIQCRKSLMSYVKNKVFEISCIYDVYMKMTLKGTEYMKEIQG